MSMSSRESWAEVLTPRYAPITATLCLGVGLLAFNIFLASTALPTAVKELGGVVLMSWATTLYLVFAIMGGSIAALCKQRFGARMSLLLSALVFLMGTLMIACAPSMPQIILGRTIQGISEGVIAGICYALIPELFPSRLVPRAFAMQASIWGIAAFGGPFVTGFLTEIFSWRAAFLIDVPLVLIFAALVACVAPSRQSIDRAEGFAAGFPLGRLLTIGAGIVLIAIAGLTGAALAAGLLLAAALILYAAVRMDTRSASPILPTKAFSLQSVVGAGFWVVLMVSIAASMVAIYLVLILEQLWGVRPGLTGAISAILAMGWSGSAMFVSGVQKPTTRLHLIWSGAGLITLGIVGTFMAFWLDQLVILIVARLATGIGFGISWGFLSQTMMESVPLVERDRTSAVLPTQTAGDAIGAALVGLVANVAGFPRAETTAQLHAAINPMLIFASCFAVIAFLAALRTAVLAARSLKKVRS